MPENKTVKVGDDVELVCRYISGEATHVTWLKHYNVNGSYSDENGDLYFTILKVLYVGIIVLCDNMVMIEKCSSYTKFTPKLT